MGKGKTNKSFTKRLKVTRTGKVLARKPGKNHFNAKASRVKQLDAKGTKKIKISRKTLQANVPKNANKK